MKTVKLGSTGEDVKTLQRLLNLTADGIFGANTEKAVKEFQSKNKLTVDGIVGANTWKALGVTSKATSIDNSIIYKPLSSHITKFSNRPIKYLAIHFTAGSSSSAGKAQSLYHVFSSASASADFAVDDSEIVQFNPDIRNYYCWAVGDIKKSTNGAKYYGLANNKNTISIEICSTCKPSNTIAINTPNHVGWSFTENTINNAVKLAKILINKYNIPLDNVVRHYDITGKLCPGIIGWNDYNVYDINTGKATNKLNTSEKWLEFKKRLK